MRNISLISRLMLCGMLLLVGCAPSRQLTIVHTNDTHTFFYGVNAQNNACLEPKPDCTGGAARLATVLEQAHAQDDTLILDAGDRFQGTLFYAALKSPAVAEVFARLPYDAFTFGNHEFDDGCAALAAVLDASPTPVLAANVSAGPTCPVRGKFAPYMTIHKGGLKLVIIGLAYEHTSSSASPCPDMSFQDARTALETAMQQIQSEQADVVVVLSHNGYARDMELAQQVPGPDIFVGGHTHTLLQKGASPVASAAAYTTPNKPAGPYPTVVQAPGGKKVLVVTAKKAMEYVGTLQVRSTDTNGVEVLSGDAQRLDASVAPQPAMQTHISALAAQLQSYTQKNIGELALPELPGLANDVALCRRVDCLTGMIVADALLEYGKPYGAQMALINGGSLRNTLQQGPLTQGDALSMLPLGNTVLVVDVPGSALLASLSHSLDGLERGSGRFVQVAGLAMRYDSSQPPGQRLIQAAQLHANGTRTPLTADKIYRVAMLNYMYKGGDGYTMMMRHKVIDTPVMLDVDVLTSYLARHRPLTTLSATARLQDVAAGTPVR